MRGVPVQSCAAAPTGEKASRGNPAQSRLLPDETRFLSIQAPTMSTLQSIKQALHIGSKHSKETTRDNEPMSARETPVEPSTPLASGARTLEVCEGRALLCVPDPTYIAHCPLARCLSGGVLRYTSGRCPSHLLSPACVCTLLLTTRTVFRLNRLSTVCQLPIAQPPSTFHIGRCSM